MKTYRMIVKTEGQDYRGKPTLEVERVRNIPESHLDSRRATARMSSPQGATRTIKVVSEN